MFDPNKFKYFWEEQNKIDNNKEIQKAIKKQIELSTNTQIAQINLSKIEDKRLKLIKEGVKKIPKEVFKDIDKNATRLEHTLNIAQLYANDDKYIDVLSQYNNSIPELIESSKLENEFQEAFLNYALCYSNLNKQIKNDRLTLFSKEYIDKMSEYADDGILLYYLETPDAPILNNNISHEDLLDSLIYGDFRNIKIIYSKLLNMNNPGVSMKRKIEDINSVFNNISNGYFRPAAMILFSLLESEHKKAALSYIKLFQNKKKMNGLKRKKVIDDIVSNIDDEFFGISWIKINLIYGSMVTGDHPIIDRNKLIHGDYDSDDMDVNIYDITKLLLLYINLRLVADHIALNAEITEEMLNYIIIYSANNEKLKNSKNSSIINM